MNAKLKILPILVAVLSIPLQTPAAETIREAATEVTIEDVGDVASFGRNVRYLGFAQTTNIRLRQDCSSAPPEQRCVTLAPAPGVTTFDEADLARIKLPARATRSLVCFAVNSFGGFEFLNTTGVPQPFAEFATDAVITIESPVLDDPALINRSTGLPFGGRIVSTLNTYREVRSVAVDELAFKELVLTRHCNFGILCKRGLMMNEGLSEALANQVFQKPITLRFGAAGTAQLISFANYLYGIRLYGD